MKGDYLSGNVYFQIFDLNITLNSSAKIIFSTIGNNQYDLLGGRFLFKSLTSGTIIGKINNLNSFSRGVVINI